MIFICSSHWNPFFRPFFSLLTLFQVTMETRKDGPFARRPRTNGPSIGSTKKSSDVGNKRFSGVFQNENVNLQSDCLVI